MQSDDAFNILALDGGGIRGIYAAHVLARLEDNLGLPVRERFDLIAGTSTGSILAGAASMNIPMETLVGLFETQGTESSGEEGAASFPSFEAAIQHTPSTGLSGNTCPK